MATSDRIKLIHNLGKLAQYAYENDIDFIITSFSRTPEEQNKLYKEGKSKCDGYAIKSRHQLWRAFDVAVIRDGEIVWEGDEYTRLGEYWESLGGVWGGRWASLNDIYHFEV